MNSPYYRPFSVPTKIESIPVSVDTIRHAHRALVAAAGVLEILNAAGRLRAQEVVEMIREAVANLQDEVTRAEVSAHGETEV